MKKVCIIGHFATYKYMNDGQTVKTNEIYKELKKYRNLCISIVDTQNYKKRKYSFMKEIFDSVKNNEVVILIVASGGIKILAPLLTMINTFFKKKICYCTIGSWLADRVENNKFLLNSTKRFDRIFVETDTLKMSLENIGYKNVKKMLNFKKLNFVNNKFEKNSFCIFSRIIKEKGIEDAIYAISSLRDEGELVSLDIYGPIDDLYRDEFLKKIEKYKEYIKYCGNVSPSDSVKFISKYYVLLFPTHFINEGLPGTIIDSYFAGTPIIASNWNSAREFINDKTGYIYSFASKEELKKTIKYVIHNHREVISKRKNCIEQAEKFCPQNAILPLIEFINGG